MGEKGKPLPRFGLFTTTAFWASCIRSSSSARWLATPIEKVMRKLVRIGGFISVNWLSFLLPTFLLCNMRGWATSTMLVPFDGSAIKTSWSQTCGLFVCSLEGEQQLTKTSLKDQSWWSFYCLSLNPKHNLQQGNTKTFF